MIGAIIGDIVGSIYEWHDHRSKDFPLFGKGCFATDDSIMTIDPNKSFGMLLGLGTKVKLVAPSETVERFKGYVEAIAEIY